MTGAYLTADGGASWRMFNLGSVPTAFDPSRPQTIYAGAEAVYRSDDSGRTWRGAGPGEEHAGVGDRGPRRPRPLHRRPRTLAAAAASPSYRGGRGEAQYPWPAERRRLAGSRNARLADAAAGLDRRGARGPGVTGPRHERVFALRAEGGAAALAHAVGETGVYEGAEPGSTSRLRAEPASPPAPSGRDPRSGVVLAYATLPLARIPGSAGPAAGESDAHAIAGSSRRPRTAVAPGMPPMASCWRACARPAAAKSGERRRGRGPHWGRSRSPLRFPLVAYVGLRGIVLPGRGEAPFNGIANTADGGKTRRRARGGGQAVAEPPAPGWRSARSRTATPCGSTRRPTSASAPNHPDVCLRHRPLPHLPDPGRRRDLGDGELGGRGRPLDHAAASTSPPATACTSTPSTPRARLHHLHRHRPVPQRGRRASPGSAPRRASPASGATPPTGSRSTPK